MSEFWISPSSFAWAWTDCKRCWWLSLVSRVKQPRAGLPPVVERVDRLTLDSLRGMDLTELGVPGVVRSVNERVKAIRLRLGKHYYVVGGQYDILVELADGTFGVFDVKMTQLKDETAEKYRLQNAAYAFCLRNPATGKPLDVTQTGLLVMLPIRVVGPKPALHIADQHTGETLHETYSADQMDPQEDPEAALVFAFRVIPQATSREEVESDCSKLRETLEEMASVIDAERPPLSAKSCSYCAYVRTIGKLAEEFKRSGLEAILSEDKS